MEKRIITNNIKRLAVGVREIKQKSKGADIYYNGKIYITPDVYLHGSK